MMLKVLMEFRRGVLFVRLRGSFNSDEIVTFNKEVKEVIIRAGIRYVVLNTNELDEICSMAIKEIKKLRKIVINNKGAFFVIGNEMKEIKKLVNLENELNVFERVVI